MTLSSLSPSPWILHHGIIIIIITLLSSSLLLQAQHTSADPSGLPPGPDTDPDHYGKSFNPSMGVVIIVLIAALFFMGFFSIYIRHCSEDTNPTTGRNRAVMGSVARSRRVQRGLDRDVIESFPTFDYASVKTLKIGKGALECAVCITEFEDDDTLRLIPKCDHVFHPECIDAWLVGHTTCPVCRSSLVPDPNAPADVLGSVPDLHRNESVSVEVAEDEVEERENENESMEQPLSGSINRSRTMRRNLSLVGRPRWLGKMRFTRSFSTGHVAVKQWENMERFTLRLPDEVRKQVMSGKLERTTSLVVLPRETSSRRGYRTGFGDEGSSRGRFGSLRVDRGVRSDRWVFSLAPPFFSRAPSVKSPKVMAAAAAASREGSLRGGSIRSGSTRLPV